MEQTSTKGKTKRRTVFKRFTKEEIEETRKRFQEVMKKREEILHKAENTTEEK